VVCQSKKIPHRFHQINERKAGRNQPRRLGAARKAAINNDQERLALLSYQPSAVSYQLWRTALLVSE
jgi:hypothetical protein